MRSSFKLATVTAVAAVAVSALAMPAFAECKRFGFLVNDYGKDGPTKDAKALLDKTIASKMAERGIKDYKTGAKSVKCELFLNFIVFDEHTCTAEATVCWGGSALPKSQQASDETDETADKPKTASSEGKHHKKAKAKETAAKSSNEDGDQASGAGTANAAKAEADSKSESKPAEKSVTAAVSAPSGVADPVKPRVASASSETAATASASTRESSSVVTGSVDAPKKKTVKSVAKRKAETGDDAGYPQPVGPAQDQ